MPLNIKRIFKVTSIILLIFIIFFISLAYFGYLDLKKTLIAKIADKSTSLIGQRVDVGDLSFSPSGGVSFHNISIKNPKGFDSGQLLYIKRLYVKLKYSELFRGRFYFKNIAIYSPELTVIRDKNGGLNISDKLMLLLTKKSALKYQVDELDMDAGSIDFNKDKRYMNSNINLHLKNLSSEPGAKTLIKGHTSYAEENMVRINGWAYLKDEPKKFNVSILSDDFSLSAFREFFNRYKINAERAKINLKFNTEGDSVGGFNFKSKIQIKGAGFIPRAEGIKDILLNIDAFFKIRDYSVVINDISMYSGDVAALRSKAVITDIRKDPSYRAEIKINRIDLSAFNFMEDLKVSGIMTSDNLSIEGKFKKTIPYISGTIQLGDTAIKSNNADIEKIKAKIKLLSDKEMSIKAEATAKILKAGKYLLDKPADIRLSIDTQGKLERIAFVSSVAVSPFEMRVKGDKSASLDSINFTVNGVIKDMVFSGKSFSEIKGIRYADFNIPGLKNSFSINYRKNLIIIKDLKVEGDNLKSSVNQIDIKMPEKKAGYVLKIMDMNASYPEKEAEVKNFDLYLNLYTGKKITSGDFDFSTGKVMFQGITSGKISGSGRFDEKEFFVNIPGAEISGGRINLAAMGKTSKGPFPVKISAVAENLDMGFISGAASKFSEFPYSISGGIMSAAFGGTMNSVDSLYGNASVKAGKVSVLKADSKRNILKDVSLNSEIIFEGNDFEFKAAAGARNIFTSISGIVKRFDKKDRSVKIKANLPEVKVTDIRDSFWDIFPDSLLYAGLDGSVSSDVSIAYGDAGLKVNGELMLKDILLEGENREYSVGPINGVVPIAYAKNDGKQETIKMPSFEPSGFDNLYKSYSQEKIEEGYSKLTIGSLSYGFRFLENINVRIKQNGSVLNIGRFNGNIFGGRLNGSATIDISNGLNYRVCILLKGLSLTKLCEGIEPIKGYISGRVDGIANLKGSGIGISQLIGKADLWTYSAENEKTKISKEFLKNIGGPSIKAYLGDRSFDKGIMSMYLQNGFLIFNELEISNRNFWGITDLSVKVMPFNNRISIDHLMWTIIEAAQRAKVKQ
jgi:uncharacterized protein involved in outer membrane biogenesis